MALGFVLNHLWHHRSNRGRRLATLGRAVRWQVRKHVLKKPMDLPIFSGLKLRCYPHSMGAGVMIYSNGWPDYDDMHFVKRYLRPDDRVIDVGANIGIYAMLAASVVGSGGRVIAFEAGKDAFRILTENVQLNQLTQIEPRCLAIGPTAGEVKFLQDRGLVNRVVSSTDAVSDDAFAVMQCTTIDQTLDESFALGKIDIEGFEPLAFDGAQQALAAGNPAVWLMEFKDQHLRKFDWTAERFAGRVEGLRYRLAIYDADQNRLEFPQRAWETHDNVLAIHQDAVDEVLRRLHEWQENAACSKDHSATAG